MEFTKKNILVITDGSQGMISQVMGLAQQISANIESLESKIIFPWSKLQPGILPIFSWIFLNEIDVNTKPDIIISCGRRSVYLSIYFKRKYKDVITIHIQNPKINFQNFDYIIAPEHDNIEGNNVLSSIGALHRFTNETLKKIPESSFNLPKKNLISVFVGGDNNHYSFSKQETINLAEKIIKLKKNNSMCNFFILTSRRTSKEIKNILKLKLKGFAKICEEDDKNAYIYSLKFSEFFIVSSDSTSMISECAFTGKPIYIFHLPFKRISKRLYKFHNLFEKLNITKKLPNDNVLISWNYESLDESKRIASIVKERIIKEI